VGIASEGIMENVDLPMDEGTRAGGSYRCIIVGGDWWGEGRIIS